MSVPIDRVYSETHEWYLAEGDEVTIGITQFAADELTDITYVEQPQIGKKVKAGETFGEVESVKATSEITCNVAGEIIAVNEELADFPELINQDAFGKGWIAKVKAANLAQLENLLSPAAYEQHISQ